MAALQYPIVIADMPMRWDEPAWLPDPSPVFEDTANANYNMIRDIESHSALLSQLVPPGAKQRGGSGAPTAGGATSGGEDDESDAASVGSSDRADGDGMVLAAADS